MQNTLGGFKKAAKIVGLGFLLVAGLVTAVFLGQGVKNYLAKASSCPAASIKTAQVTANSAVISWETQDVTQGRVEYGTNASSLTFSAPESSSGKIHNVPLTLLTPSTLYYYLVTIGSSKCDSTGKACTDSCIPFTFTTSVVNRDQQLVTTLPTITPTPRLSPTLKPTVKPATSSATLKPTSTLSAFCLKVEDNLGAASYSANWATVKQYDIDGNGMINSVDIIKCKQSGK